MEEVTAVAVKRCFALHISEKMSDMLLSKEEMARRMVGKVCVYQR